MFDERYEGYKAMMVVSEELTKPGSQKISPYHWLRAYNPSESDTVMLNGTPIPPLKTVMFPPIDNHIYEGLLDLKAASYTAPQPPTDLILGIKRQADLRIEPRGFNYIPSSELLDGDPAYEFRFRGVLSNIVGFTETPAFFLEAYDLISTRFNYTFDGDDILVHVSALEHMHLLSINCYCNIGGVSLFAQSCASITIIGGVEDNWQNLRPASLQYGSFFIINEGHDENGALIGVMIHLPRYSINGVSTDYPILSPLPELPDIPGEYNIEISYGFSVDGSELIPPEETNYTVQSVESRFIELENLPTQVIGVQNPQTLLHIQYAQGRFTK